MSTKVLDYVAQPNAYTCQSACIAKVLGTTDVEGIRAALEAIGTPGSPATMGEYLKSRVQFYKFLTSGSLEDEGGSAESEREESFSENESALPSIGGFRGRRSCSSYRLTGYQNQ